jgi:hypothetical protein
VTFIAPIVEGHGEVEAVPILLRRIASDSGAPLAPRINPPIRIKSGSFLNDEGYFARYIRIAAHKAAPENGAVLILLDCEDDCPATLGPALLSRARAVRADVSYVVALAYREFETWFIVAARSLGGQCGLSRDILPPPDAELFRDAKGWLGERMNGSYDPVTHQHQFARTFDLGQARASHSFNRLYGHVHRFLRM